MLDYFFSFSSLQQSVILALHPCVLREISGASRSNMARRPDGYELCLSPHSTTMPLNIPSKSGDEFDDGASDTTLDVDDVLGDPNDLSPLSGVPLKRMMDVVYDANDYYNDQCSWRDEKEGVEEVEDAPWMDAVGSAETVFGTPMAQGYIPAEIPRFPSSFDDPSPTPRQLVSTTVVAGHLLISDMCIM